MPIISGGSSGSVALTSIADSTLGVAGTFSFTSIPQTYKHLLIVAQIRLSNASAFDNLVMRLDNDSNTRYESQNVSGSQATASAAETNTTASPVIARVAADSATAGFASGLQILIPNYANTTLAKEAFCTAYGSSALTTGTGIALAAGVQYNQLVAVTRIDLFGATSANCIAGSRATLYALN